MSQPYLLAWILNIGIWIFHYWIIFSSRSMTVKKRGPGPYDLCLARELSHFYHTMWQESTYLLSQSITRPSSCDLHKSWGQNFFSLRQPRPLIPFKQCCWGQFIKRRWSQGWSSEMKVMKFFNFDWTPVHGISDLSLPSWIITILYNIQKIIVY